MSNNLRRTQRIGREGLGRIGLVDEDPRLVNVVTPDEGVAASIPPTWADRVRRNNNQLVKVITPDSQSRN